MNINVARDAAVIISDRYSAHRYGRVGAVEALAECGLRVPKERAVEMFRSFAPDGRENWERVILADARIGQIEAGGYITRAEWDSIKVLVAARVVAALELPMPKEMQNAKD